MSFYLLFLCKILSYVDGYCKDNDNTFDDILQVWVDSKEVKAVVDYLKENYTKNNSRDCTNTTVE